MRRASPSTGMHAPTRRHRWIAPLLAVIALAVVAPDAAGSAAGAGDPGHRATFDHAHVLATVDAAIVTADRHDRRDVPTPWVPGPVGLGALAVAAVVVLRAHARRDRIPAPAFRRRAPPPLGTIA